MGWRAFSTEAVFCESSQSRASPSVIAPEANAMPLCGGRIGQEPFGLGRTVALGRFDSRDAWIATRSLGRRNVAAKLIHLRGKLAGVLSWGVVAV